VYITTDMTTIHWIYFKRKNLVQYTRIKTGRCWKPPKWVSKLVLWNMVPC